MLANHSKSIKKITFNNPRASFNIRRHAGWCVGVGEEKMKRVPSRFGSLALLYFSRLPVLSYRTVSILILISGIDKLREFMIYCSFSCLFEEYFGTSLSKGKCTGRYNIAKSVQCALDCPISPKKFCIFLFIFYRIAQTNVNPVPSIPSLRCNQRVNKWKENGSLSSTLSMEMYFQTDGLRQDNQISTGLYFTHTRLDHFSCAKSFALSTYFHIQPSPSLCAWEWVSRQLKTSSRASAILSALRPLRRMARSLI